MSMAVNAIRSCGTIGKGHREIDWIDRRGVAVMGKRGEYVTRAIAFRQSVDDLRASASGVQGIGKVAAMANDLVAGPAVTRQIFRAMVAAFIEATRRPDCRPTLHRPWCPRRTGHRGTAAMNHSSASDPGRLAQ